MPAWLPFWLRDPLIHFLVIGGMLFAAYGLLSPDGNDPKSIAVTRNALLNFAQYRANTFNFDLFDQGLDELTTTERQALVDEYVREEALYREALALGLDQGDYIIRQRLIQRLELLLEDNNETTDVDPDELIEFYTQFNDDYWEPAVYTFTHVFFNAELRGEAGAHEAAFEALVKLNEQSVPFSGALGFGDRPLYFQNYVERTRDFIEANLGQDLISLLDDIEPSKLKWRGPVRSPYGWHLILLTAREEAWLPSLEEIEDRVREDHRRTQKEQVQRRQLDQVVNSYEVNVLGLEPALRSIEASQREEN